MANPPFNVNGVNTDQIRKLPCTLWFFYKGKPRQAMANAYNSQDRVLMIDARNVHHVESARNHRFTEEQLANLTAIVWLHRGEDHKFCELVANDQWTARKHLGELERTFAERRGVLGAALAQVESLARKATPEELNRKRKRKDDDDAGAPITAGLLDAQLADFAASVYALKPTSPLATPIRGPAPGHRPGARHRRPPARRPRTGRTRHRPGPPRSTHRPIARRLKYIEADHQACGRLLDRELEQQSAQLSSAVLAMREAAR